MPDENNVIGIDQLSEYDALIKHYIATHGGGSYELPIASASQLGGIKIGNNLTIDALTGKLDADMYFPFAYAYEYWRNARLSRPIKIGSMPIFPAGEASEREDIYASTFSYNRKLDGNSVLPFYYKIASRVKDLIGYSIVVNDGNIKEYKDYTRQYIHPSNPRYNIDGPKLWNYCGYVGLEFYITGHAGIAGYPINIEAVLYYTRYDDESWLDVEGVKHLYDTTSSDRTITRGNITVTVSRTGNITINGNTNGLSYDDPNLFYYSEHSGSTGNNYLPEIAISEAPILSKLSISNTSIISEITLYDSSDNPLAIATGSSLQSNETTHDFIKGSEYSKPDISYMGLRLFNNMVYDNVIINPCILYLYDYNDEPIVTTQPEI